MKNLKRNGRPRSQLRPYFSPWPLVCCIVVCSNGWLGASSFTIASSKSSQIKFHRRRSTIAFPRLHATAENGQVSSRRSTRRRKRRPNEEATAQSLNEAPESLVEEALEPVSPAEPIVVESSPSAPMVVTSSASPSRRVDATPITLTVPDVRQVLQQPDRGEVSLSADTIKAVAAAAAAADSASVVDDEELADDEEWEYYDDDEDESDMMAQLLKDARQMSLEPSSELEQGGSFFQNILGGFFNDAKTKVAATAGREKEGAIKSTARNVLSTIVTIDFFVVCGFLLWFLAGIVVRSTTGNDAVQIAFNNQFATLVQPALGVLMLGVIAGGTIFKDEDEQ
jgi:hypothetical protein